MGEMQVPETALFGASTQRAVLNFPISKRRFRPAFIKAIGAIKLAAIRTNRELGLVPSEQAEAIERAALEVYQGKLDDQFVVDIFQTGSGTSTNMNANEVIANRACELLGGKRGEKGKVHPNDHVNACQSSNDVIPTAMHVSAILLIQEQLVPGLKKLKVAFEQKANEFATVIKTGRTHLQDATPMTLGQEMSGYGMQITQSLERLARSLPALEELALGGTAVGTGLNTHPDFAQKTIKELSSIIGHPVREARNHFEAQGSKDAYVEMSGQLKTIASSFLKIANDIRWLSSGPRCAIGEIGLPETQPGSSIMPAKVNPVICESVMMAAAQVIGNDACITTCAHHGNFELNVMMPVMADNLLESIEILAATANNFCDRCVSGITADTERCAQLAELSLATCTSLAPKIGYDKAALVAKEAMKKGLTVRQAAQDLAVLPEEELARVLDLMSMTKPGL